MTSLVRLIAVWLFGLMFLLPQVLGAQAPEKVWRNLADEEAARATAREFVRDRVDLIVAFEAQTVRAAKAATSDIPVVFLRFLRTSGPNSPRSWSGSP